MNDGKVNSSAAAVSITASVANAAPVANPGLAQSVVTGSTVTLDGSASSDANGDSLTYAWTLASKPAGSSATLSSTTSAKPTFSADVAGAYVANLIVNDGKINSNAVTVAVTATKYADNADGTVTDATTGLTWMRCAMGQTWDGSTCTGTTSTYTSSAAMALTGTVSFAGQSDWRLPNIRELQGIADRTKAFPAIDRKIFPNAPGTEFWSSSTESG